MDRIEIDGGYRLNGAVCVQGSKNAVLPVMAAAVLNRGMTVIHNCPKIADVEYMADILRNIGCLVTRDRDTIAINAYIIDNVAPDAEYMSRLRASILLLGALLGREKEAVIPYPGGCKIGKRPIDMHLYAARELGTEITKCDGKLFAKAARLTGSEITFGKNSVGATQNAVLMSVLADGVTHIRNAAREPEVTSLLKCLNSMGARIGGIGTSNLKITGVKALHDVVYTVESDRIVAGTYILAAVSAGGHIAVENAPVHELTALIDKVEKLGTDIICTDRRIEVVSEKRPVALKNLKTKAYPGFPTDLQPQMMSVLGVCQGKSQIVEEIFENRFMAAFQLVRMGADISVLDNTAQINGVERLTGALVSATDLRAGAALVIAGLNAYDKTVIDNAHYIKRGYVDICKDLEGLGARIRWIKTESQKNSVVREKENEDCKELKNSSLF